MKTAVTKIAQAAWAISGLGYLILSPIYETGIWKLVVPVLGATDLLVAHAIWKHRPWINPWLLPIGIGTLLVAVPFWGSSSAFHGDLAAPMLVVESATIVAATCLIVLARRSTVRDPNA